MGKEQKIYRRDSIQVSLMLCSQYQLINFYVNKQIPIFKNNYLNYLLDELSKINEKLANLRVTYVTVIIMILFILLAALVNIH